MIGETDDGGGDDFKLLSQLPVFVEAAPAVLGQVLGPDGGQRAEAVRSFDVAHDANDDHRRRFQNGYGFDDFLLVDFYLRERTNKNTSSLFRLEYTQHVNTFVQSYIFHKSNANTSDLFKSPVVAQKTTSKKFTSTILLALTWSGSVGFTQHVAHARLVPYESGQVDGFLGIVLRERLHLSAVPLRPLLWVEPHRSMARCAELAVRLNERRDGRST